jgi:hypothetical protein
MFAWFLSFLALDLGIHGLRTFTVAVQFTNQVDLIIAVLHHRLPRTKARPSSETSLGNML